MRHLIAAFFLLVSPALVAEVPDMNGVIQTITLNTTRPYFIPTHPRVTTTIRFPDEIGAPDGSVVVFTEDAAKAGTAEYLVTWQAGDSYLTITPLKAAAMANLNVPYHGRTCVFYFYAVSDPLKAVASVNLVDNEATPAAKPPPQTAPSSAAAAAVTRETAPPETDFVATTPARLIGFLDRLKLLHAAALGPELAGLADAMHVEVAVSREELLAGRKDRSADALPLGVAGEISRGVTDDGLFQIVLLRAVRDRRLNCIGFVCLVRNTSDQELTFDVNSFGARAGAEYLAQRISDATPILKPSEQRPAYFIVQPGPHTPLDAVNDWRITLDLVAPRLNPGAAIARGFLAPVPPS